MVWTDNGTTITIPFNWFWDTQYKPIIYPTGAPFQELFPDLPDLTEKMKQEIMGHFYYRQISDENPQRFLRHFQQTCRLNCARWQRLIDTETALRPDDAIYNYDLTEEGNSSSRTVGSSSGNGNSTNTGGGTSWQSDTPDGSVDDIERYMSAANKEVSNATSTTTDNTEGQSETTITNKLTRKGNIGVMTSAQIIGGYRDATEWSAWDVIFNDLERHFLGVF